MTMFTIGFRADAIDTDAITEALATREATDVSLHVDRVAGATDGVCRVEYGDRDLAVAYVAEPISEALDGATVTGTVQWPPGDES